MRYMAKKPNIRVDQRFFLLIQRPTHFLPFFFETLERFVGRSLSSHYSLRNSNKGVADDLQSRSINFAVFALPRLATFFSEPLIGMNCDAETSAP
jgi:hypothetical protein